MNGPSGRSYVRLLYCCLSAVLLAVLLTGCSSGGTYTSDYQPPPAKSNAEKLYDQATDYWPQYAEKPGHKSLACGFTSDDSILCNWAWSDDAITAATARALRDCSKKTSAECFTFAQDGCMSEWAVTVSNKYGGSQDACTPTLTDSEQLYEAGMANFSAYQEKSEPKARVCGLLEPHAKATCYFAWEAATVELALIKAMQLCREAATGTCFEFARNGILSDWAQHLADRYMAADAARVEMQAAINAGTIAQQTQTQQTEQPQADNQPSQTQYSTPQDDDSNPTAAIDTLSGVAAALSVLSTMPSINTNTYTHSYTGGQDMRSLSNSQATRPQPPVMQYFRAR